jgi:pre-mRNA-splicing helicase BRR2
MDIHLQSFTIPHFPSLMIAMSKPAYLAILETGVLSLATRYRFCSLQEAVPTYGHNLLTHCLADDKPDRFLNIELDDLQPHLDHINDKGLVETLKHGIGYYHEALDKQDKRIVQRLSESGAIQLLVAPKDTAWSLPVTSYMVIIMGVQFYEGKEHRYIDYPVMDVLQMMGRACGTGAMFVGAKKKLPKKERGRKEKGEDYIISHLIKSSLIENHYKNG